VPTSMGWYLYAVVGAQAVLAVPGLRRIIGGWSIALGVLLFGLLDLYAMNAVALPYYAGMLGRKPNGALAAFHVAGFRPGEMFQRLTAFKPAVVSEPVMIGMWALYVCATLMLMVMGIRLGMSARVARVGRRDAGK
jgi:hypothetical protein